MLEIKLLLHSLQFSAIWWETNWTLSSAQSINEILYPNSFRALLVSKAITNRPCRYFEVAVFCSEIITSFP